MSFMELLKNKNDKEHNREIPIIETKLEEALPQKTAVEILRSNGFKIKLITPTSFGTQIDFAKHYDEESIKNVLNSFNIKIKGNSVFIV